LADVLNFPPRVQELVYQRVYDFSTRLAALVKEAEAGGLPIETQIAVFEDALDVLRAEIT
jgi:hypothetical protein